MEYYNFNIRVYTYTLDRKECLRAILDLAKNYSGFVFLSYSVNRLFKEDTMLFDIDNIDIYLYHYMDKIDISNKIELNKELNNYRDSDVQYCIENQIKKLAENTEKTVDMLEKIYEMNENFEKLVLSKLNSM